VARVRDIICCLPLHIHQIYSFGCDKSKLQAYYVFENKNSLLRIYLLQKGEGENVKLTDKLVDNCRVIVCDGVGDRFI